MKRRFTDPEVVALLLSGDTRHHDQALTDLYRAHGPALVRLVVQYNGSVEDGEEVTSDALVGFLTNVRAGKFELQTAKISTYLGTLAKYTWWKRQRRDKPWPAGTRTDLDDRWLADLPQPEPVMDERQDAFQALLAHLGARCRALLEAVVAGFTMQEIALELDLGNADNAKAHKYNCLKKLDALRQKQL